MKRRRRRWSGWSGQFQTEESKYPKYLLKAEGAQCELRAFWLMSGEPLIPAFDARRVWALACWAEDAVLHAVAVQAAPGAGAWSGVQGEPEPDGIPAPGGPERGAIPEPDAPEAADAIPDAAGVLDVFPV